MDGIKLSVIVPCWNAENYIEQTLNSLVNQTLDGIEIICVNDGSTDRTGEILELYAKAYPNITVVHQEDLGQANAVNRGIRMARGEYIAECDSDDFVALTAYEKAYNLATYPHPNANPGADAVRFGWYGIYPDGLLQPIFYDNDKRYIGVPLYPAEMPYEDLNVVFGKQAALFVGIYRRQFILDNNLFWRENRNFEDTSIEFKVRALAKDYRIIAEPLYYYRRNNPNSGNATIFDDDAIFEQFDEIDRFIEEHSLHRLQDIANAMRFQTIFKWGLPRGEMTQERVRSIFERMEADFAERPPTRTFLPDRKDWLNFNILCG